MNPLLEAAQARARNGAYLLPVWWTDEAGVCQCPKGRSCPSPGKHPLLEHGLLDASANSSTIEGWWQRWPLANLAERTDEIHRIDIDLPEVAEALAQDTALPNETEVVRTPRGGMHIALVARRPVQGGPLYLKDGRRLGDLKAAGGYVLILPSKIGDRPCQSLSPDHGRVMTVDDPREWLAEVLPAFGYALGDEGRGARQYAALGGTIYEGEGRHNALTSYAGRIWIEGMAPEAYVGALRAVNQVQCRPPLPDDELMGIARHFVEGREQTRACHRPVSVHVAVAGATGPTTSTLGREEVLAALSKWLCLPDLEAVDVLMATAIAIYLPGDPLWLYYVGPPGGTKTEPLRALRGPKGGLPLVADAADAHLRLQGRP